MGFLNLLPLESQTGAAPVRPLGSLRVLHIQLYETMSIAMIIVEGASSPPAAKCLLAALPFTDCTSDMLHSIPCITKNAKNAT